MKTLWLCLLLLVVVPLAQADILTLNFDIEFSGATAPAGSSPWITATFTDVVGGVNLKINPVNLVGSEFIGEFSINLNPALNPNNLTFGLVSGQAAGAIQKGVDCCKADGDGFFDVMLDYANSGGNRFTAGETSEYFISGIAGLDVSDFNFTSVNGPAGKTGFLAAAHIQSIGANGNDSGWIAPNPIRNPQGQVPEPSSVLLLSTIVGAVSYGMRKRLAA
jgi:hypothetical protein